MPHPRRTPHLALFVALAMLLLLTACAAGPGSEWAEEGADPAGFLAGFWHGLLLVITLIVSFFTDQVRIYEPHNVGTAYDIAFVLGTLAAYGSGVRVTTCKSKTSKKKSLDSDDIANEVERRVKRKVEGVLDDDEWGDLGDRIELKVKAKLRKWLDEEDRKDG